MKRQAPVIPAFPSNWRKNVMRESRTWCTLMLLEVKTEYEMLFVKITNVLRPMYT